MYINILEQLKLNENDRSQNLRLPTVKDALDLNIMLYSSLNSKKRMSRKLKICNDKNVKKEPKHNLKLV